jgi:uncharacterized protein YecT (DUF1311 family)
MKYLILALLFFVQLSAYSQAPQEVTPDIEKKIRQQVDIEVGNMKSKLKAEGASAAVIEFSIDTLRIERYFEMYLNYDYSTAGMSGAGYNAAHEYDSLLNKYYKKLLAKLKPEDQKILTRAQKAWITYRDTETALTETMSKEEYSGGGTIQLLINSSDYLELIKSRVIALFEHLRRGEEG